MSVTTRSGSYPPLLGLSPGQELGGGYTIDCFLGAGWEGEVYKVRESVTGLSRAAKFYISRDGRPLRQVGKALKAHARKLERLRECSMVLQYHHSEVLYVGTHKQTALISEYAPGLPLDVWLAGRREGRLESFEALSLLHGLATGLEAVHACGEYHGDLHAGNILLRRRGVQFQLKLLDFYHHGRALRCHFQQDLHDLIHLFYDSLGGRRQYSSFLPEAKAICRGMRKNLIQDAFPTVTHLRQHLESFEWD